MKRLLVLLCTLLLILGSTGCIQMDMKTELKADGSGTCFMSYGISPSVAQALQELAELGPMDEEMPSLTDYEKSELEAECKKHGVTLKNFEEKEVEGAKQVTLELDFPGLEALYNVLGDSGQGMLLFKTEDGNYVLRVAGEAGMDEGEEDEGEDVDLSQDAEEFDPANLEKSMELMGTLMSSMGDLNISLRITVPGDIIESNAMRTEGRTAIWEINGENMMAMAMTEDMGEPEIIFSGKGLDLEAPLDPNR